MAKAKKLKSGSWRCLVYDFTDEQGKRHYESFTADTKKEAEYLAAEFTLNKKNNCAKCNLTFGEALEHYIDSRSAVLSPTTIREYKRCGLTDLKSLQSTNISKITQELIQGIINELSYSHSQKSVRNTHGLISVILKTYRPDFMLNTALPEKIRPDIFVPTDDIIGKILALTQGSELEIPIMLAAFCSLRRSEVCALTSDNIVGNRIHVKCAMVLDSDKQWIIKQPKSYAGDRWVEAPDFVIKKLEKTTGKVTNLNPDQISHRFGRVLKANSKDLPHFRFHDLRHYYASISHALGIPDAYIMQDGGWGNDKVLKSVYRHVLSDYKTEMSAIRNNHFSKMQHEMQHAKK